MSAGVPDLPLGLDPLIAEAKERARRRRYVLAAAGLVTVGSLAAAYVVRGSERPRPAAVATPACRPAQLRAEEPRFDGAYTGHVVDNLTFRNVSASSCSVGGWPTLIAVLPDGRHVAARVGHVRNTEQGSGGVVTVAPIVLRLGGTASFHVIADDGTGLDATCPVPLPSVKVLVVPPGASAPARGATTMPYCHDRRRLLVVLSPVVPGRLDRYGFR